MNPKAKYLSFLALFVITTYVMREGNLSVTKNLGKPMLRRLYDYARPSSSVCDGVSLSTAFSQSDINRAQSLQNSLSSIRKGNPLQTIISSGDLSINNLVNNYLMGLIPAAAVWAAFFVLSIICCCCAICNWCCMFGCCKGCKICKCCKKPEGTKRKRLYCLGALLFMAGVFATGIAGVVFSSAISNGMLVSYCSTLNMVEDFAYGNKNAQWLGVKGLISSLGTFAQNFKSTVNSLTQITTPSDYTTLQTKYNTATTTVKTFYNTYKSVQVTRADPAVGGSYAPDYISNLGDTTTNGTYTFAILSEMTLKYAAITNAKSPVNTAIQALQAARDPLYNAIVSGQNTASSMFSSIDSLVSTLNNTGSSVNTVITIVGKVVLAIFIVYIVLGALPIISVLLISFLKIKFFSKVLHITWFILGFLTIIGFLVCTIFYPVSIIFTEFCEIMTVSVNDPATFNSTIGVPLGQSSSKSRDLMYSCMFGSGNALDQLGISTATGYFSTLFTNLNAIDAVAPLNTSSSPVPAKAILYQVWYLNAVKTGLVSDSQQTTADLVTLDSLTNKGANTCTPDQDTWLLSAQNCTSSLGSTYTSTSSSNYNVKSATCIGLDNWVSSSGTGAGRYGSSDYPSSCPSKNGGDQLTYVKNFVDGFTSNRNSITSNYGTIYTDMTTNSANHVQYDEKQFGAELYTDIQPYVTVKSELSSITDILVGSTNGILTNANCNFVGSDIRQMTASLCTGFIASIYQATVVLIIASVFSFFGAIFVFCLAKRILNEEDDEEKRKEKEKKESAKVHPQYQYH